MMRGLSTIALLSLGAVAAPSEVAAKTPGDALAERAEKAFRGFGGQRVRMKMTVEERGGESRVYEFVELSKDTGTELKLLLRFESPPNLTGSALLSHEPERGAPDTWMYVAETKTVRRVSGADRSARFLASDLDIEQLSFPRARDYTHRIVGEDEVDGHKCQKLEQTPKSDRTNYQKLVTCIDSARLVVLWIDYFDRSMRPVKRLVASEYENTKVGWRPHRLEVKNLNSKRITVLEIGTYETELELSDNLFSVAQLQRR